MPHDSITLLRRLRLARGYSQRDLAKLVGVSAPTILRIERGRVMPHPRTRVALERVFGVPFDVLAQPDMKNAAAPSEDDGVGVSDPTRLGRR